MSVSMLSKKIVPPRDYAKVLERFPPSYTDYSKVQIPSGDIHDYKITKIMGSGKYSYVFGGINKKTAQPCVIKALKPVREKRIKKEIKILQNLSNCEHVIKLYDVVKDDDSNTVSLIFEKGYCDLVCPYPTFSPDEVRMLMYGILKGLDEIHGHGIIHRDIKPDNMSIKLKNNIVRVKLLDLGLADFYVYGKNYPVRVASRYYKAPELLLGSILAHYDYSIDIWAAGCILGAVIFRVPHLFMGARTDAEQLAHIVRILGSASLFQLAQNEALPLRRSTMEGCSGFPVIPWHTLVSPYNRDRATPDALDLLGKMLRMDHKERLTVKEALRHRYFDPIRLQMQKFSHSRNKASASSSSRVRRRMRTGGTLPETTSTQLGQVNLSLNRQSQTLSHNISQTQNSSTYIPPQ